MTFALSVCASITHQVRTRQLAGRRQPKHRAHLCLRHSTSYSCNRLPAAKRSVCSSGCAFLSVVLLTGDSVISGLRHRAPTHRLLSVAHDKLTEEADCPSLAPKGELSSCAPTPTHVNTQAQLPDNVFLRLNALLDLVKKEAETGGGAGPTAQYAPHVQGCM